MDKCPHEQAIIALQQRDVALEKRDDEIVDWMKRLEGKLDDISKIMREVIGLEKENTNHKEAIARAFTEIEKLKSQELAELKNKVSNLEAAYNKSVGAAGMLKFAIPALWTVLGGGLTYIATMLLHIH
jgi:chromosome segregation ATPase